MTLVNVGSINIDRTYRVDHIPAPGETISAFVLDEGLGGKGANQSIAAARAGAKVRHVGAIGPDGGWTAGRLAEEGIEVGHILTLEKPTGHAVIALDRRGENAIIVHPGANGAVPASLVEEGLEGVGPGDRLVLQNEINANLAAAELARERGMEIIYSAAPFVAEDAARMLPLVDVIVMNEIEAGQLAVHLGLSVETLPVKAALITRGAKGAVWIEGSRKIEVPAFPVEQVIDTTGAGDCFTGWFAGARERGASVEEALREAAAAAAIKVTRKGASAGIPFREEVEALLAQKGRNQQSA